MSASLAASDPQTQGRRPTTGPSPAVMGTYARQDLVFERGEGAWLITAAGERYLDFASGVAVNVLGHAHPRLVAALTEQAQQALAHVQPLSRRGAGAAGRSGSSRRRSPTGCSSAIRAPRPARPRSRRRGAITMSPAARSAGASSPSRAPSTAARWRPSPPAATRSISKASGRRSRASTRCRSATSPRPKRRSGRRRPAIMVEPMQGEGGVNVAPRRVPAGPARAVRQARPAAHPRRGAVRHRPHRQAVRARVGGHHAGPHGRSPRASAAASRSARCSPPRRPPRA